MIDAKEAARISLYNSNERVSSVIYSLESGIKSNAKTGLRTLEDYFVIRKNDDDINIADVIEYFESLGYIVEYEVGISPINGTKTYSIQLKW
ncbi:hypothetical protein PP175_28105 (plasmid) [Aneurinibacillus sp. Ricciae_BoGa-3]|uniref:hypothetical protein n=1 Tax=Aneurinibacillus sp. Ricciae_BoGa-3 TaxID=3022697 RepID=UPI00234136EE|nr:hypothetical protein [Aneurinibacillus sp. Ricciae_BoGa-3]WCK57054.1 hypothetical protein PP175_28105 [Aneurinibacillus sp. Ricciae_BoGa-3]